MELRVNGFYFSIALRDLNLLSRVLNAGLAGPIVMIVGKWTGLER